VGERLTLADICFFAEVALFYNEKPRAKELEKRGLEPILNPKIDAKFPRAMAHFAKLSKHLCVLRPTFYRTLRKSEKPHLHAINYESEIPMPSSDAPGSLARRAALLTLACVYP